MFFSKMFSVLKFLKCSDYRSSCRHQYKCSAAVAISNSISYETKATITDCNTAPKHGKSISDASCGMGFKVPVRNAVFRNEITLSRIEDAIEYLCRDDTNSTVEKRFFCYEKSKIEELQRRFKTVRSSNKYSLAGISSTYQRRFECAFIHEMDHIPQQVAIETKQALDYNEQYSFDDVDTLPSLFNLDNPIWEARDPNYIKHAREITNSSTGRMPNILNKSKKSTDKIDWSVYKIGQENTK